MEKEIIERWENGKGNLREWFESQNVDDYCDYEKIVHALIRHCLNYGYDTDNYGCISEQFEVSDYECDKDSVEEWCYLDDLTQSYED